ncbi:MAG: hypothetical protein KME64_00675 [Scytonematopsis contorta HA4267-MV1]|nr:hypothetical protein [Scytonematopsis contorta HA4267-MV1]
MKHKNLPEVLAMEIRNLSYLAEENCQQNLSHVIGGGKTKGGKPQPGWIALPKDKFCPLVITEDGLITHRCPGEPVPHPLNPTTY